MFAPLSRKNKRGEEQRFLLRPTVAAPTGEKRGKIEQQTFPIPLRGGGRERRYNRTRLYVRKRRKEDQKPGNWPLATCRLGEGRKKRRQRGGLVFVSRKGKKKQGFEARFCVRRQPEGKGGKKTPWRQSLSFLYGWKGGKEKTQKERANLPSITLRCSGKGGVEKGKEKLVGMSERSFSHAIHARKKSRENRDALFSTAIAAGGGKGKGRWVEGQFRHLIHSFSRARARSRRKMRRARSELAHGHIDGALRADERDKEEGKEKKGGGKEKRDSTMASRLFLQRAGRGGEKKQDVIRNRFLLWHQDLSSEGRGKKEESRKAVFLSDFHSNSKQRSRFRGDIEEGEKKKARFVFHFRGWRRNRSYDARRPALARKKRKGKRRGRCERANTCFLNFFSPPKETPISASKTAAMGWGGGGGKKKGGRGRTVL